jgi:hypothetical protein
MTAGNTVSEIDPQVFAICLAQLTGDGDPIAVGAHVASDEDTR